MQKGEEEAVNWNLRGIFLSCSFLFASAFLAQDEDALPPLIAAVRRGDVPAVTDLLAEGASPDARDAAGMTALHYAAYRGEVRAAEILLDAGARLTAVDLSGLSPLHAAAFEGRTQVVSLMIRRGAPLDATDRSGFTPLHYAAAGGHVEAIRLLLEAKADPAARSKGGATALALAERSKSAASVALLRGCATGPAPSGGAGARRPGPIVITDDDLLSYQDATAGWTVSSGSASSSPSTAGSGQPAPLSPLSAAAGVDRSERIRELRDRIHQLEGQLPTLREQCERYRRFNDALDNGKPLDQDLNDLANQYQSGDGYWLYSSGAKVADGTMKAKQLQRDTQSACDGIQQNENAIRAMRQEISRLQSGRP